MTKRNLSKLTYRIKSFLFPSRKQRVYLRELEKAYLAQSAELKHLKRQLQLG